MIRLFCLQAEMIRKQYNKKQAKINLFSFFVFLQRRKMLHSPAFYGCILCRDMVWMPRRRFS